MIPKNGEKHQKKGLKNTIKNESPFERINNPKIEHKRRSYQKLRPYLIRTGQKILLL